ncbi:hypothetical protein HWB90_gp045 [Mycobacterium phage Fowlmouth]|uniref:Uncharacterized protein n=1 Tax=Mycobacterium phage Fowlmouth TaxID=2419978 RepID=A0A3G2KGA2_9CAUD|nr:hypothetical protein HWB90_gp045 [Mycobacterium phage Fowlmouth]AYN57995.1 hypothetical protein SEA_FOWLMOUTH_45 [Mycobacterium phage Fowlmouth]
MTKVLKLIECRYCHRFGFNGFEPDHLLGGYRCKARKACEKRIGK